MLQQTNVKPCAFDMICWDTQQCTIVQDVLPTNLLRAVVMQNSEFITISRLPTHDAHVYNFDEYIECITQQQWANNEQPHTLT